MTNQDYIPALRKILESEPRYTVYDIIDVVKQSKGLATSYEITHCMDIDDFDRHNYIFDIIHVCIDNPTLLSYTLEVALRHISHDGYIFVSQVIPLNELDTAYRGIIDFRQNHQKDVCCTTLWDSDVMVIRKELNQYHTPDDVNGFDVDMDRLINDFSGYLNPVATETFLFPYRQGHNKYRYSVLTCMFNGYEIIREPENPEPDVEYILVTDDPNLKTKVWKPVLIDSYFNDMSGHAKTVYAKYHPFEFVNTDTVLWVDGSIQILKGFSDVLMEPFIRSNTEVLEMNNTISHDCIYEMNRWLENGFHGYDKEQYDASRSIFDRENQWRWGQVQTTIYGCKNTKLAHKVNDITYDMLSRFRCNHDVLILYMPQRSYIINKFLVGTDKLMVMNRYELFGSYFRYCWHGSNESQQQAWEDLGHVIDNDPINPTFGDFGGRQINLIKLG